MKHSSLLLVLLFPVSLLAQEVDTTQASAWFSKAVSFQKASRWDSAIHYSQYSAKAWGAIAQDQGNPLFWERHFQARNKEAYLLWKTRQYEDCISYCKGLADEFSEKLERASQEKGMTYYWWARSEYSLFRNDAAIRHFQAALTQFTDPGHKQIPRCHNLLGILYERVHDYEQSISETLLAARIFKERNKPIGMGGAYSNVGLTYSLLGDSDKALEYFFMAYNALRDSIHPYLKDCLINIGEIYRIKSDFEKALDYFQQAGQVSQDLNTPPLFANMYIGALYYDRSQHQKALEYKQKALQIAQDNLPPENPTTAALLTNIGTILRIRKDYEGALSHHTRALEIFQATRHPFEANAIANIGRVYRDLGNFDEALSYFREAISINEELFPPYHPEYLNTLIALADLYVRFNNPSEGLVYFQKALVSNLPSFKDPNPFSNPPSGAIPKSLPIYVNTLAGKAATLSALPGEGLGNLKAADSSYQLVEVAIEQMRRSYQKEGSKLDLVAETREIFSSYIGLLFELGALTGETTYYERAFVLSEKARAAVLSESLRASKARRYSRLPLEILEKEEGLRTTLSGLESTLFNLENAGKEMDSVLYGKIKRRQFKAETAYDSLLIEMENGHPRYFQLKYGKEVITHKEVQEKLKPDEMLISYIVGDSTIYAFGVHSKGLEIFEHSLPGSLGIKVDQMKTMLEAPDLNQELAFINLSHSLYSELLAPFTQRIERKRLIIIPDGPLAYLPFEVLLTDTSRSENDYRSLPYLLEKNPVFYAFSGSLYFDYDIGNAKGKDMLAFAPNFDFATRAGNSNRKESGVSTSPRNSSDQGFQQLSGATEEVAFLSTIFTGKTFSGEFATEGKFKSLADEFDILHLATHAIVDDEDPMDSRLLFTHTTADTANDGDLHAWELYNMELNAQLAVLSACNTGFGKIERGEGVMSLGRAFAYAGVPSIVMSLWPAQDASTADLMKAFYTRLVEGKSKDKALREAKLEYLANAPERLSHPFYWAGFVVQGDARPLKKSTHKAILLAIAIGGLLLVAGFLVWRRKPKNTSQTSHL